MTASLLAKFHPGSGIVVDGLKLAERLKAFFVNLDSKIPGLSTEQRKRIENEAERIRLLEGSPEHFSQQLRLTYSKEWLTHAAKQNLSEILARLDEIIDKPYVAGFHPENFDVVEVEAEMWFSLFSYLTQTASFQSITDLSAFHQLELGPDWLMTTRAKELILSEIYDAIVCPYLQARGLVSHGENRSKKMQR